MTDADAVLLKLGEAAALLTDVQEAVGRPASNPLPRRHAASSEMLALESEIAALAGARLRMAIERVADQLNAIASSDVDRLPQLCLSFRDAADALGVSVASVRRIVAAGALPTVTLPTMATPLIPAAALVALVSPDRWRSTGTRPVDAA